MRTRKTITIQRIFHRVMILYHNFHIVKGNANSSTDGLLTTICELSKLITATPIPNATAIMVADTFIKEVILRYGLVDTIISDNGPCFISEIIKEIAKLLKFTYLIR